MLPQHVPWLVTLKEISPLAALTETPQFLKTTMAQFDCIQFRDNKAGCLNESQTRFSYVREREEFSAPNLLTSTPCCERLPQCAAFHFLKKSPTLYPLFRLTPSRTRNTTSSVFDSGSLRLFPVRVVFFFCVCVCVETESRPAALSDAVADTLEP